jgi:pilus assembly protein CpaB
MAMAAAPVPKPVVLRSAKPQGGAITLIRGVESSVINVR